MPTKQAFQQAQSHKVFGHPLRVGLYARVSTHDQQTLPLQIRTMREYAAKRNWTIVAQTKEVGSGVSQRELRERLPDAARRNRLEQARRKATLKQSQIQHAPGDLFFGSREPQVAA